MESPFPSLGRSDADRAKVAQLLASPDVFTTTLMALVIDEFGTEALAWSPATLRLELEQEYHVKLPPLTLDRLAAGQLILTSDDVFHRLCVFIHIANVLAGTPFDGDLLDLADAEECSWAVTEIALLRPDAPDGGYSEEIAGYIRAVVDAEGLLQPPAVLRGFYPEGAAADWKSVNDFADDPEMFQAVSETENARSGDLDASLQDSLEELMGELRSLPMIHGDSAGVDKFLAEFRGQSPQNS